MNIFLGWIAARLNLYLSLNHGLSLGLNIGLNLGLNLSLNLSPCRRPPPDTIRFSSRSRRW